MTGFILAAGALLVAAWHQVRVRQWRRRVAALRPVGPDGLVAGADAVSLGAGGRGVLLLHGFGDTPQSLGFLAARLHQHGWTVRVPLLAGHGRTLDELAATRAADWLAAARAEWRSLRAECDTVCLVGQSVGGAIATLLAVEAPPARLVLLAPYFQLRRGASRLGRLHWLATPIVPFLRTGNEGSILDPEARAKALGGGVLSPRLLAELDRLVRRARQAAPALAVPTLVLHSRNDPRIPVPEAEAGFAAVGATPKRLEWLDRSAHVISADHDRDRVAAAVADWIAGAGTPAATDGAAP